MNKKRQSVINWGVLRLFFLTKLNIWIIVSSTLVLLSIYLYFLCLPNLIILPSQNSIKVEFYTDSGNGGNSIITQKNVSDSIIHFEFDLKEGFVSPYAGLSISPKKEQAINISHYNLIHLNIEGKRLKCLDFSIYTPNPNKNPAANSNELCFHTNLEISPKQRQYFIKLDELKIPDWWREVNYIPTKEKIIPDLKHILRINISSAYSSKLATECSLSINSISFERNNAELIIVLITIELIVLLLLAILHFIRESAKKKKISVTIAYKSVDIENENQQLKGFLEYINNNFHECDFTLEQVSNHTGINQRRIANSIQQTFGCNFKTYVNQIRINESKRLLKDTNLNIGEIAFSVGFSNQSHFNRVFKSLENISPSEFRQKKL